MSMTEMSFPGMFLLGPPKHSAAMLGETEGRFEPSRSTPTAYAPGCKSNPPADRYTRGLPVVTLPQLVDRARYCSGVMVSPK